MSGTSGQFIFVYNADAGKWNGYVDMMHKVFSPKTYPCKLCDLTYGVTTVKPEWKKFVKTLPKNTQFLHKDEWKKEFKSKERLPAVFWFENDTLETVLPAREMNKLDLKGLITAMEKIKSMKKPAS